MRVAAVTMVYNEATLLPVWCRHYAAQVGAAHCHVVDHGSEDGGTRWLGAVNVLRLPRSPHDDTARAAFMSRFCASLLSWYDAVIHVDVDEMVLADPRRWPDLVAYAAGQDDEVTTAIGLNVLHLPDLEPPLDPACPVGLQRRHAWPSSAMCKPVLIRRPVQWSPGFHSADAPLNFGGLFLFHLRYHDRPHAMARLRRTRAMEWADDMHGAHQRVPDTEFAAMLDRLQAMDRSDAALDPALPPLAGWLAAIEASQIGREDQMHRIDLALDHYQLLRIPRRFVERIG